MALLIPYQADDVAVPVVCPQLSQPFDCTRPQQFSNSLRFETKTRGSSEHGDYKFAPRRSFGSVRQRDHLSLEYKGILGRQRVSDPAQAAGGGGRPPPLQQGSYHEPFRGTTRQDTVTVDITSILDRPDSNESSKPPSSSSPLPPSRPHAHLPAALSAVQYSSPITRQDSLRSFSLPPPQSLQPVSAVSSTPSPASVPGAHPLPLSSDAIPVAALPHLQFPHPPAFFSSTTGPQAAPPRGEVGLSTGAVAKRSMPPYTVDSPAKKQSKWSAEEDALIIELRGSGMKWEDISKRLPGRSAISCRLHYQNYLERRSEWDEERKNKLARLYER